MQTKEGVQRLDGWLGRGYFGSLVLSMYSGARGKERNGEKWTACFSLLLCGRVSECVKGDSRLSFGLFPFFLGATWTMLGRCCFPSPEGSCTAQGERERE